jgi:hypothetical protein
MLSGKPEVAICQHIPVYAVRWCGLLPVHMLRRLTFLKNNLIHRQLTKMQTSLSEQEGYEKIVEGFSSLYFTLKC